MRIVFWPDMNDADYDYVPLFARYRDAVEWTRAEAKRLRSEGTNYGSRSVYVDRWEFPDELAPEGATDWYGPTRGFWINIMSGEEGFNYSLDEWK